MECLEKKENYNIGKVLFQSLISSLSIDAFCILKNGKLANKNELEKAQSIFIPLLSKNKYSSYEEKDIQNLEEKIFLRTLDFIEKLCTDISENSASKKLHYNVRIIISILQCDMQMKEKFSKLGELNELLNEISECIRLKNCRENFQSYLDKVSKLLSDLSSRYKEYLSQEFGIEFTKDSLFYSTTLNFISQNLNNSQKMDKFIRKFVIGVYFKLTSHVTYPEIESLIHSILEKVENNSELSSFISQMQEHLMREYVSIIEDSFSSFESKIEKFRLSLSFDKEITKFDSVILAESEIMKKKKLSFVKLLLSHLLTHRPDFSIPNHYTNIDSLIYLVNIEALKKASRDSLFSFSQQSKSEFVQSASFLNEILKNSYEELSSSISKDDLTVLTTHLFKSWSNSIDLLLPALVHPSWSESLEIFVKDSLRLLSTIFFDTEEAQIRLREIFDELSLILVSLESGNSRHDKEKLRIISELAEKIQFSAYKEYGYYYASMMYENFIKKIGMDITNNHDYQVRKDWALNVLNHSLERSNFVNASQHSSFTIFNEMKLKIEKACRFEPFLLFDELQRLFEKERETSMIKELEYEKESYFFKAFELFVKTLDSDRKNSSHENSKIILKKIILRLRETDEYNMKDLVQFSTEIISKSSAFVSWSEPYSEELFLLLALIFRSEIFKLMKNSKLFGTISDSAFIVDSNFDHLEKLQFYSLLYKISETSKSKDLFSDEIRYNNFCQSVVDAFNGNRKLFDDTIGLLDRLDKLNESQLKSIQLLFALHPFSTNDQSKAIFDSVRKALTQHKGEFLFSHLQSFYLTVKTAFRIFLKSSRSDISKRIQDYLDQKFFQIFKLCNSPFDTEMIPPETSKKSVEKSSDITQKSRSRKPQANTQNNYQFKASILSLLTRPVTSASFSSSDFIELANEIFEFYDAIATLSSNENQIDYVRKTSEYFLTPLEKIFFESSNNNENKLKVLNHIDPNIWEEKLKSLFWVESCIDLLKDNSCILRDKDIKSKLGLTEDESKNFLDIFEKYIYTDNFDYSTSYHIDLINLIQRAECGGNNIIQPYRNEIENIHQFHLQLLLSFSHAKERNDITGWVAMLILLRKRNTPQSNVNLSSLEQDIKELEKKFKDYLSEEEVCAETISELGKTLDCKKKEAKLAKIQESLKDQFIRKIFSLDELILLFKSARICDSFSSFTEMFDPNLSNSQIIQSLLVKRFIYAVENAIEESPERNNFLKANLVFSEPIFDCKGGLLCISLLTESCLSSIQDDAKNLMLPELKHTIDLIIESKAFQDFNFLNDELNGKVISFWIILLHRRVLKNLFQVNNKDYSLQISNQDHSIELFIDSVVAMEKEYSEELIRDFALVIKEKQTTVNLNLLYPICLRFANKRWKFNSNVLELLKTQEFKEWLSILGELSNCTKLGFIIEDKKLFEYVSRSMASMKLDKVLSNVSSYLNNSQDLVPGFSKEFIEALDVLKLKLKENSSPERDPKAIVDCMLEDKSGINLNSAGNLLKIVESSSYEIPGIRVSSENLTLLELKISQIEELKKKLFPPSLSTEETKEEIRSWARRFRELSQGKWSIHSNVITLMATLYRAVEVHNEKKMKPRYTQLTALLLYIDSIEKGVGRIGNISTGEGKSLIVNLLAIIRVLNGEKVDIITSSKLLAVRDADSSRPLFSLFDITVGNNCDDSCERNEETRKKVYRDCQVVFGEATAFQRDYLLSKYLEKPIRPEFLGDSVIVDEIDSMLIDTAERILYISHNIEDLANLRELFALIWSAVQSPDFHSHSDANVKKVVDMIKSNMENQTIVLPKSDDLNSFIERRLSTWVNSAFSARDLEEGDQYVTARYGEKRGTAVVMDLYTGVEQLNTQWSNGLQQFIQIKHSNKITDESLKAIFMSNMSYFKLYKPNINGMTGTIGGPGERKFIHDSYQGGIDFFQLPRFKEEKNVQESNIIVSNSQKWVESILVDVEDKLESCRKVETSEINQAKLDIESEYKNFQDCVKNEIFQQAEPTNREQLKEFPALDETDYSKSVENFNSYIQKLFKELEIVQQKNAKTKKESLESIQKFIDEAENDIQSQFMKPCLSENEYKSQKNEIINSLMMINQEFQYGRKKYLDIKWNLSENIYALYSIFGDASAPFVNKFFRLEKSDIIINSELNFLIFLFGSQEDVRTESSDFFESTIQNLYFFSTKKIDSAKEACPDLDFLKQKDDYMRYHFHRMKKLRFNNYLRELIDCLQGNLGIFSDHQTETIKELSDKTFECMLDCVKLFFNDQQIVKQLSLMIECIQSIIFVSFSNQLRVMICLQT